MGHKVNPNALRFGHYYKWNSLWFDNKHYSYLILEEYKLRQFIFNKYKHRFYITKIVMLRENELLNIHLFTNRPALLLGNGQKNLKLINNEIKKEFYKKIANHRNKRISLNYKIKITIKSIQNSYQNAQWIANYVANRLEQRASYRLVQKEVIKNAIQNNVLGIKTRISGRLNGADISRSEGYSKGRMPLNTFRSEIQYGSATAITTYGTLGVKIWLYLHDNLDKNKVWTKSFRN